MYARWPVAEEIDKVLLRETRYLDDVSHDLRVRLKKMIELKEKVSKL